jgi:hypothetical protein
MTLTPGKGDNSPSSTPQPWVRAAPATAGRVRDYWPRAVASCACARVHCRIFEQKTGCRLRVARAGAGIFLKMLWPRRSRRQRFHQGALGRLGRMGIEARVMAEQRRAIGANGFARVAHIDEDMRMVEGRLFSHAHELAGADLDHRDAGRVVEMGNDMLRHADTTTRLGVPLLSRRTIAIRIADS